VRFPAFREGHCARQRRHPVCAPHQGSSRKPFHLARSFTLKIAIPSNQCQVSSWPTRKCLWRIAGVLTGIFERPLDGQTDHGSGPLEREHDEDPREWCDDHDAESGGEDYPASLGFFGGSAPSYLLDGVARSPYLSRSPGGPRMCRGRAGPRAQAVRQSKHTGTVAFCFIAHRSAAQCIDPRPDGGAVRGNLTVTGVFG
jgi:hypothetical protein